MAEGGVPIAGAMTTGTVGAKLTFMDCRFSMTGRAGGRQIAVIAVGMALGASQPGVTTSQRETGMVEGGVPVAGVMTTGTVGAKLTLMDCRFGMTGRAGLGQAGVHSAGMALAAGKTCVTTR